MSTDWNHVGEISMKKMMESFARKVIDDQRGQILPWMAVMFVVLLGMGGLSIDAGRAYVVRAQLQTYANAAALAAAGVVYNTSTTDNATTYATSYSASTGNQNANASIGSVTTTVTTKCLSLLLPSGSSCTSSSSANAVQVRETATISTTFMRLFGIKTLNVSALATASMQGKAQPWNVAIILDTTGSMSTTDTNCKVNGKSVTEFACATNGIQALLAATDPCPAGSTSCTNSTANFHVALFMFPGVSTGTVSYLTSCSGTKKTPQYMVYTLPKTGQSSYAPITYTKTANGTTTSWTGTYEVTYGASDADANGFVSNYYLSTASNGLYSSSSIVQAVTGCMSPISSGGTSPQLQAVSTGGITYYASVIYAAQAALVAEQTLYPSAKNAIILLSDGQANLVASGDFPTAYSVSSSSVGLNTLTTTGYYPSMKDECQQAIIAAQDAASAGTTVFGVAYGAEQSGCHGSDGGDTDTTLIATGKNQAFTLTSTNPLTPCVTMENIASSLDNFYSDYNQSGSGSTCEDASHTVTSLQDIFLSIAASFTNPRLLPNSAT